MRPDLRLEWNESEFQLAILQVLLGARRINPREGGVRRKELMEVLKVEDEELMIKTLKSLHVEKLITVSDEVFQISALGVDLVEQHFPDCTPFNWLQFQDEDSSKAKKQKPPPWSPEDGPGPWPPSPDPDDPSRVPKKGQPSSGAGEIALPLPSPSDLAG